MKTEVRTATIEDAEDICHVIRRSITMCCQADHRNEPALLSAWLTNKTSANVASWIADPQAIALVATQYNAIVGFILLSGEELALCYVTPEVLYQGIGKTLLRQVESSAFTCGCFEIHLSSTKTAQSFYQRNGFTSSGASQNWGGLESQPMKKTLVVTLEPMGR